MKKLLTIIILAFAAVGVSANPKINFDSTSHDFGTIKEDGGKVTAVYKFTNTGDEPLTIINVSNGGCGCTTPSYPKEPIAPGKQGEIKVTFQPKGRRGEFKRSVKVKSNTGTGRRTLTFSGVIIP